MKDKIDKAKDKVKEWMNTVSKSDGVNFYGRLRIQHFRDGEVLTDKKIDNVVVNDGLAAVTALLGDGLSLSNGDFGHIAIGTDSTAASSSDTSLGAEHARESATASQTTTNVTNDTLQLQNTFSISSSVTIEETGVFNAASGGTMFARQTTGSQTLQSGDSLQITWEITAS